MISVIQSLCDFSVEIRYYSMKNAIISYLCLIFIASSCSNSEVNDTDKPSNPSLEPKQDSIILNGDYLIMNSSFFNDTLLLKRLLPEDSLLTDKTLMTFTDDSIHLERWNPNPFDGKMMMGYDNCAFERSWNRIEMNFTLKLAGRILRRDYGNAQKTYEISKPSEFIQFILKEERGYRDFTNGGEEIRSDIQLR